MRTGSDAEAHAGRRFPHKTIRQVGNGLRPQSIRGFLDSLPLVFQRNQAAELAATYHFTFTGEEAVEATVIIKDKRLQVEVGHVGEANLQVIADSRTWLEFLHKNQHLAWGLLRCKIKLKGSPKLLLAFGRCFA